MHRDYHSANLMVADSSAGILDFQDAFYGPVTYDLASLLRDCYIAWPQELISGWLSYYHQKLNHLGVLGNSSLDEFIRWFDWMGMQRHLKALLTFARKHVRDSQSRYLAYVPRTLNYLISVSARYPELEAMHFYLRDTAQPAYARFSCAQ
jgi:aminoglycoside/choline kinase family phosphotransferase